MSLNIERVHVMERDATGRDSLVKRFPYARFVDAVGGSIAVQGGRFYSDGSNQPVIPYKDVPDWAWKAVKAMSPAGRMNVGLPMDMDELPSEGPAEPKKPSKDAQISGEPSEPEKTLVDHIYELKHDVDAHWTKGGLPDLNSLKEATGRYVSRGEVSSAAPGHKRKEN